MPKKAEQQRERGQYLSAAPWMCQGEPTFTGTRKLVRDCIEMAAKGLTIAELARRANLPRAAIVEALHVAADVLQRHYTARSAVASRARERLSACA